MPCKIFREVQTHDLQLYHNPHLEHWRFSFQPLHQDTKYQRNKMMNTTSTDMDYGRSGYAPRDPIEAGYSSRKNPSATSRDLDSSRTGPLVHIPSSQGVPLLTATTVPHVRVNPFRRGEREVDVVVSWMADPMRRYGDDEVDRVVKLPKRVWLRRNLGGSFEELFVSRE